GFHRDLVLAPLEGFCDFIENAHVLFSTCIERLRQRLRPGVAAVENDAIPQNAWDQRTDQGFSCGMTQRVLVLPCSEVKSA
ncbi:MAG: hypothetical protein V4455_11435, partial [Pseudomonadota bacterium]